MGEVLQEVPDHSAETDALVDKYLAGNGKELSEDELHRVFKKLAERGELDALPKQTQNHDSDQQIAA